MLAMLVTFVTFVQYHYHKLWFLLSEGKDSYCRGVDWDRGALLDISILSEDLSRFLFDWMDILAKIVFSCVVSCRMLTMFQQIYQNSESLLRTYFYFINSFSIEYGKLLVGGLRSVEIVVCCSMNGRKSSLQCLFIELEGRSIVYKYKKHRMHMYRHYVHISVVDYCVLHSVVLVSLLRGFILIRTF